jgi:hypothetical protein
MAIATGTALAIAGTAAAAGGIGSAVIGSKAAGKAAAAQKDSATYAADLQKQEADNSLDFQKSVYSDQKAALAPYQAQGLKSLDQLATGTAAGGEFEKSFTADDMKTLDPGYDFRLQQGQQALERAEAAGGSIGSGAALKAAARYSQDYASGEFSNAYNRFMTTRQDNYNNVAALAGVGQTATQQANAAGTSAANNVSNINSTYATNAGNDIMAAGNAQASGYVGSANAWGSGLNSIGNSAMNLFALSKLTGSGAGRSTGSYDYYANGSLEE